MRTEYQKAMQARAKSIMRAYYGGADYDTIAEAFNIPQSTVRAIVCKHKDPNRQRVMSEREAFRGWRR